MALIGFAFVMSISPGPGNFLLLASGVNFGFSRSIPLVLLLKKIKVRQLPLNGPTSRKCR
jgi:hypothetical protein